MLCWLVDHQPWLSTMMVWLSTRCRFPIKGWLPRKVSPGWQFTGKNLPRSAAARARWIFAGKLSAREDFTGGRSYNEKTFYGGGDILIRGDISIFWLSFPERIFHGRKILMWHRQQTIISPADSLWSSPTERPTDCLSRAIGASPCSWNVFMSWSIDVRRPSVRLLMPPLWCALSGAIDRSFSTSLCRLHRYTAHTAVGLLSAFQLPASSRWYIWGK